MVSSRFNANFAVRWDSGETRWRGILSLSRRQKFRDGRFDERTKRGMSPITAGADATSRDEVVLALASVRTESGRSLLELVEASPVLLIFLRHFGCSFCRQAISDISELKDELERRGVRPVFVHLGTPGGLSHFSTITESAMRSG